MVIRSRLAYYKRVVAEQDVKRGYYYRPGKRLSLRQFLLRQHKLQRKEAKRIEKAPQPKRRFRRNKFDTGFNYRLVSKILPIKHIVASDDAEYKLKRKSAAAAKVRAARRKRKFFFFKKLLKKKSALVKKTYLNYARTVKPTPFLLNT